MEGLIGVLIGSLITYIIFRTERKDKLSLASKERQDKFRLVAIEKRLEAHQKAMKYWYKMIEVIHKQGDIKTNVLLEAREFWYDNSLYLEKETRKRFSDAISIVSMYRDKVDFYKLESFDDQKEELKKEFLKDWSDFMALPAIIQNEVQLEPIQPDIKFTPEGDTI